MAEVNSRTKLFYVVVFVFLVAALVYRAFCNYVGYDYFWHLATGRNLVENGLWPTVDYFTFTMQGQPLKGWQGGFQLVAYLFSKWLGPLRGYQVLLATLWTSVGALFFWYFYRSRIKPAVYLLGMLFVFFGLESRSILRPEIFSILMSVGLIELLRRNLRNPTPQFLVLIFSYQLVWNWIDLSSVFGYFLVGMYFVDLIIFDLFDRQLRGKDFWNKWLRLIIFGTGFLAAGFLVPTFEHPINRTILVDREWFQFISEYMEKPFYALTLIVRVYIVLVMVALAYAVKIRHYFFCLTTMVLLYQAIAMHRLVPYLVLLTLPFLIHWTNDALLKNDFGKISKKIRVAVYSGYVAVCLVAAFSFFILSNVLKPTTSFPSGFFPETMLNYLSKTNYSGKIFTLYEISSSLVYRFDKRFVHYIDGRGSTLFSLEKFKEYLGLAYNSERFGQTLKKHNIEAIIVADVGNLAYFRSAAALEDYGVEYSDERLILMTKGKKNFRLGQYLYQSPDCFPKNKTVTKVRKRLSKELRLAKQTMNHNAFFLQYLDILTQFDIDQPQKFWQAFGRIRGDERRIMDSFSRLALEFAYQTGDSKSAAKVFLNMRKHRPKDYLKLISLLALDGKKTVAEDMLVKLLKTPNIPREGFVSIAGVMEKFGEYPFEQISNEMRQNIEKHSQTDEKSGKSTQNCHLPAF